MTRAPKERTGLQPGEALPFVLFVLLVLVAIVGAAIGSLAPIDFIYDGI